MNRKAHWEQIYATRTSEAMSWFQLEPVTSLRLLDAAGLGQATWIIDIGGGDCRLVDRLVARGVECVTVLDISAAALACARARLGSGQARVTWIEADVTGDWPVPAVDIWHDRAVFHFLTESEDRARYLARLRQAVKPRGTVIIAAFALDGPEQCSGLRVQRYCGETLAAELGAGFELAETVNEAHRTPSGAVQSFCYSRFIRAGL